MDNIQLSIQELVSCLNSKCPRFRPIIFPVDLNDVLISHLKQLVLDDNFNFLTEINVADKEIRIVDIDVSFYDF